MSKKVKIFSLLTMLLFAFACYSIFSQPTVINSTDRKEDESFNESFNEKAMWLLFVDENNKQLESLTKELQRFKQELILVFPDEKIHCVKESSDRKIRINPFS